MVPLLYDTHTHTELALSHVLSLDMSNYFWSIGLKNISGDQLLEVYVVAMVLRELTLLGSPCLPFGLGDTDTLHSLNESTEP